MGWKFPTILHSPRRVFPPLTCKFYKTPEFSGVSGFFFRRKKDPGGARTHVLYIRSQPLYHCATVAG
jgi:hypothetical protein